MRVLLVEDDLATANFICLNLRKNGHGVEHCGDAETGLEMASDRAFDALVVDRMLPGLNGLTAVQRLRETGNKTPILMLTSLSDVSNRAEGLFAGADDYLCKPFAWEELSARLHALARRGASSAAAAPVLQIGDLVLDRQAKRVERAGKRIDLLAREYDVLEYLALHADQVVTRTMLLEEVWNLSFDPGTNIVESQISRLRAKLMEAGGAKLIHTTRGQGYVLRA